MTLKRALAIALTAAAAAAAALPASAAAQAQITPPAGDNYLQPILLNGGDFQNPRPFPRTEIGFVADTTTYTVQGDMFNPRGDGSPGGGGPPEPHNCGSDYGKTIWSVFRADRYGLMRITTAGPFDSVIGFVPFKGPLTDPTPRIDLGVCIDRLAGFEEEMQQFVSPGHWYAVQVGGTGATQGGQIQVKFDYQPPPALNADAVLTWKTPPGGGVKAVKLVVTAPKGSKVTVSCTKHGCQAPRAFTVKKAAAFLPIGAVGPGAGGSGAAMAAASGSGAAETGAASQASSGRRYTAKAQVHAAKKFTLLKNKSLKPGSKLNVLVTAPGWIGKFFSWPVTRNGVSAKSVKCTKPGATKPPKKGGCG
jgi:hypothetical protein